MADTPNLDKLAAEGARYTNCFNHAPVCSASRSGIITGMYPTSYGGMHHRSQLAQPMPTFTAQLRKAGYYVSWGGVPGLFTGKTDFNFAPEKGWCDERVNWMTQAPKQPFFAYATLFDTHESQLGGGGPQRLIKNVKVPPIYPDTQPFRTAMARYYEQVESVDKKVGMLVEGLRQQGLLDNTVIMFYADNGWCP